MTKIPQELNKLKGKIPINYHLLHRKNISASEYHRIRTTSFYKPIGRTSSLESYYVKKEEEQS